jgi:hypothetical protein
MLGDLRVFIPMHKDLLAEGLVPMLLLEGDYTPYVMGDRLMRDSVGGFLDQTRPENVLALRGAPVTSP